MDNNQIEVRFFLNDKAHASRTMTHVPRKGEEVRLNTGLHEITEVVWIQDGPQPHVEWA